MGLCFGRFVEGFSIGGLWYCLGSYVCVVFVGMFEKFGLSRKAS